MSTIFANLKLPLQLFRQKQQRLQCQDSPNGRRHIEDAGLKNWHYTINNWFGGAEHDISEDFAVDRRHGLRVQSLTEDEEGRFLVGSDFYDRCETS